jgi:flagellar motor protein MotB
VADAKKATIVIKKIKKGGHGGHHGGAWKVAYADFVTAMMCFFLVMWLMGADEETKASIANYFNNPTKAWRPELKEPDNIPLGNQTGLGEALLKGAEGQTPDEMVKKPDPVLERKPQSVGPTEAEGLLTQEELSTAESLTFVFDEDTLFRPESADLVFPLADRPLKKIGKIARNFQGRITIRTHFGNSDDTGYEAQMSRIISLKQYLVDKRWQPEDLIESSLLPTAPAGRGLAEVSGPRKIEFVFSRAH